MTDTDLQVRLQVAKQAAYIAGEELRRRFRGDWRKEDRSGGMKDADQASRKGMSTFLSQVYPKEAVSGKGVGDLPKVANFWVIDSLNGEENFSAGDAHYATVITWMEANKPVLGVIYNPSHEQMFAAVKGNGAYLNNRLLKVQPIKNLQDAFSIIDFGFDKKLPELKTIKNLVEKVRQVKIRQAPALDLCSVADGSADAFISFAINPWDWLAPKLIIEEAGGKLTNHQGQDINPAISNIVASGGLIHNQLIKALE